MPGKHVSGIAEQTCRRCKENSAVLVVRTEPLCRDCFVKYVHTKAIKRMESFRVRNSAPDQQRKILLPISFGVSSVSLLNILDHHLKTQKSKTGRTGFALVVLFVDATGVGRSPPDKALLDLAKERFPEHEYTSIPLHEVFDLVSEDTSLLEILPTISSNKSLPSSERLPVLLNSLASATARADVITILRTRLIVEQAKKLECEGILWGDSTTKLAEKTLAETAKGRGFSLPWQIADGESHLGIAFNYPLRDLLKKELVAYVDMADPSLSPLVHEPSKTANQLSMSSKNTTIDDLMTQYFESVEANFPSIVSNVVRTSGKLEVTPISTSTPHCSLCSNPVTDGRFGIHGWGGDQEDGLVPSLTERSKGLCYGCTRSIPRQSANGDGA
ncbi:cytoplasmic tRNA 2-thiolation protein 2 [Lophiostoma macrostomum CBS 122681]|uniref:Cytoplasmic tRNA 2-thiolation protein 2 n=1 Tax=Lophiostoma macrostomum CBS 122681 TaxID=1314788 RepID=A0A6A6SMX7_9PLEO|nr:cytoplasmic tRNA 2-thiolation protein 2 [Lophiostoma macrostomum CBS 122681]